MGTIPPSEFASLPREEVEKSMGHSRMVLVSAEVVTLALGQKFGPLDFKVGKERKAHAKCKQICLSGGGDPSQTRRSM